MDGPSIEHVTQEGIFGNRAKYAKPLKKLASITQAKVYAIERCDHFIKGAKDGSWQYYVITRPSFEHSINWNCLGTVLDNTFK